MTYTGAPATVSLDTLRMLIGDTSNNSATELLTDAECNYFISNSGNIFFAAAEAARVIAAKRLKKIDRSAIGISDNASQSADGYLQLAEQLELRGSRTGIEIFAGGLTDTTKDAFEEDTDRTQSRFRRGLHQRTDADSLSGDTSVNDEVSGDPIS